MVASSDIKYLTISRKECKSMFPSLHSIILYIHKHTHFYDSKKNKMYAKWLQPEWITENYWAFFMEADFYFTCQGPKCQGPKCQRPNNCSYNFPQVQ